MILNFLILFIFLNIILLKRLLKHQDVPVASSLNAKKPYDAIIRNDKYIKSREEASHYD